MAQVFGYKREAVRVKVMKCDGFSGPEYRKFSVDPQITSYEVLLSLLAKAFDIRGDFTVSYRVIDDYGQETYIALLSDWDLDAAFLRSFVMKNSASEPYLCLRVDLRPFEETCEIEEEQVALVETKPPHGLHGIIMNHVERTFNMVQRALNLTEDAPPPPPDCTPPRAPLTDSEFRQFLDPIGQLVQGSQLRNVIYFGGIEPSLRKVVWKHLLNVYPEGMSGKERMDYMKKKSQEYFSLRDSWREMLKNGQMVGDLAYVTSMVRKDVLRTDRHHVFYAGSDDNKNIASLFNILTTYALNHPAVSYCQGMSDLASPLLVTMNDEAHAYICFCALMRRLSPNFLMDGIMMTQRFQHLADGLQHYDNQFYSYLKSHQADDLLFCYRWLLLEMKREFAFDDALRMLEVMWSSLSPAPPEKDLPLYEQEFVRSPPVPSPRPKESAYTKVCALRRSINHSLDETSRNSLVKSRPFTSLDDSALAKEEGPQSARIVRNLNEFFSLDKKKEGKSKESTSDNSPDDSSEFFPMTTSMTRELRLELENLDRHVFGEEGQSDDVFVWENPLRGAPTPDEPRAEVQKTLKSPTKVGEGDCAEPKPSDSRLLERRRVTLEEIPISNGNVSAACEVNPHSTTGTGALPPPSEFGGGNPFLMFLCITVLCQHRDLIIKQGMDYNEMAMHFDKMVRKHNVTRVLNQARNMFASYLKEHSPQKSQNHLSV